MKISSTQLWLGEHDLLVQKVYGFAASLFGEQHRDSIIARQFHGMSWFTPEKNQYNKADLEPLFYKTSFKLGVDDCHLIILEHADMLSSACANSLLKLLEEPPIGYYFMLLAQRLDALLPTIQSRAIITDYGFEQRQAGHELFMQLFTNPVAGNHLQVMQEFEKAKMTEYQARFLIDQLFAYWAKQHANGIKECDDVCIKRADRMMRVCYHAFDHPPMPGSTKMFWRNVYLLMSL